MGGSGGDLEQYAPATNALVTHLSRMYDRPGFPHMNHILPPDKEHTLAEVEKLSISMQPGMKGPDVAQHFSSIISPDQWRHTTVGSFYPLHVGEEPLPGATHRHNTTVYFVDKDQTPPVHVHDGIEGNTEIDGEDTISFRGALVKILGRGFKIVYPGKVHRDGPDSTDVYGAQNVLIRIHELLPELLEQLITRKEDIGEGNLGAYHQSGGSRSGRKLTSRELDRASQMIELANVTHYALSIAFSESLVEQRAAIKDLLSKVTY